MSYAPYNQTETVAWMDNPRLLIIDDNEEFLDELKDLLTHSGYEVDIASNSMEAFEKAQSVKPDLILLDLKMVPKSGFQLASEIHHSAFFSDVPIIAMTGFFTEQEHIMMMQICGIKTFILKPFQPINLIAKVEFALGPRRKG